MEVWNRNNRRLLVSAFLLLLISGGAWIAVDSGDETKGTMVASVEMDNFLFTMRPLLPEELVERDLKALGQGMGSKHAKDSLISFYKESSYFLFVVEQKQPDPGQVDIMKHEIPNYTEYQERFLEANFELNNLFGLYCNGQWHRPVLSSFENVYQFSNSRKAILAFPIGYEKLQEEGTFTVRFTDRIFQTGIHKFNLLTKT